MYNSNLQCLDKNVFHYVEWNFSWKVSFEEACAGLYCGILKLTAVQERPEPERFTRTFHTNV